MAEVPGTFDVPQKPIQDWQNARSSVHIQGHCDFEETITSAFDDRLPLLEFDTRLRSKTEENISDGRSRSMKKRVSWISDQDTQLILNYLEPENPWSWKNVQSVTSDRLIKDYKYHCDRVNIRPLPSVIIQMQNMKGDLSIRQELLNLRGDRLDQKHCEALEELLRRVQFITIDLETTHLDDDGVSSLFDMIEYYDSAERINLGFNKNIGPRGWQACGRLIKKTQSLTYLDLRHCVITEQGMPLIGRSLRLGSTLHILHLENCNITGRTMIILVAALKMNELMRELFLADNKLMPSDAIQLGNLLKFNHRLQLLDIRNNHIQDVGLSHVSDGLGEQNIDRGLTTLVLWNNQITHLGMTAFGKALSNVLFLETINLGHNNITNEGIHKLKEGLFSNRSLLRLGLQTTKLSCEGAIALAEFIAESQKLIRMDLRESDIKTAGLMALSLALKVNQSVTRIDLDKEPKKEQGVKDYADTQKQLMDDIQRSLTKNKDLVQTLTHDQPLRSNNGINTIQMGKPVTGGSKDTSEVNKVKSGVTEVNTDAEMLKSGFDKNTSHIDEVGSEVTDDTQKVSECSQRVQTSGNILVDPLLNMIPMNFKTPFLMKVEESVTENETETVEQDATVLDDKVGGEQINTSIHQSTNNQGASPDAKNTQENSELNQQELTQFVTSYINDVILQAVKIFESKCAAERSENDGSSELSNLETVGKLCNHENSSNISAPISDRINPDLSNPDTNSKIQSILDKTVIENHTSSGTSIQTTEKRVENDFNANDNVNDCANTAKMMSLMTCNGLALDMTNCMENDTKTSHDHQTTSPTNGFEISDLPDALTSS